MPDSHINKLLSPVMDDSIMSSNIGDISTKNINKSKKRAAAEIEDDTSPIPRSAKKRRTAVDTLFMDNIKDMMKDMLSTIGGGVTNGQKTTIEDSTDQLVKFLEQRQKLQQQKRLLMDET